MRRYYIIGMNAAGIRFHAGVKETLDDAVAKIERDADDAVEEHREVFVQRLPFITFHFTQLVVELDGRSLARITVGETEATYLCAGCGEPASEDDLHDEPNYVGVHIESYSPVCSRCESPKRVDY